MILSQITSRVINISFKNSSGTGFVFDRNNKQYILTARHIVNEIKRKDTLKVMNSGKWNDISVELVGHAEQDQDLTVLKAYQRLNNLPCPEVNSGLVYGQDVFFLGFPYGMNMEVPENNGWPAPFVKKATVSAMYVNFEGKIVTILDGINNKGFSGGPVICQNPFSQQLSLENQTLVGLVSAYRFDEENIHFRAGQEINMTDLLYRTNTGLIIITNIFFANKVIDENPTGFPIE